jgi:hypothetical protein
MSWYVRIVETEPNRTEDEIGKEKEMSLQTALKIERGININLNKDKYHTELVER